MNKVCVYCGSSSGKNPIYMEAAKLLGRTLAKRNLTLVYGGASVGIMGATANSVLENGGKVIGVIPKSIEQKEVAHKQLTELHVVKTMHERKAMMAELSDGFIALPGGLGTFEELFEILTWAQLGYHSKPCGVLNINGYFDKLIAFVDHAVEEAFVKKVHRDLLFVEDDSDKLLDAFKAYKPQNIEKWIGKDDM